MPRCTTRVSPLSSVRSRYLPSRPTDLMVRPSSRARKCLADGCRRTERPLATETVLILRPTTSRDRSWRSVSTSGSSGTGELLPGGPGRLLLGVLLGAPLARTPHGPAQVDLGHVGPVVVRARALDDVARASPRRRAPPSPGAGSCGRSRRAPRRPARWPPPARAGRASRRRPSRRRGRRRRGRPRRRRPGWRPWCDRPSPLRPGRAGGPHPRRGGRPPGPARGR